MMEDRFVINRVDTGKCDDPYCNGHEKTFLVDTVTKESIYMYPLPSTSTLQLINFVADCLSKESRDISRELLLLKLRN